MIGRLGRRGKRHARARADELLERVSLIDAGDKLDRSYSGGMRRRLDLAASPVVPPLVLFLDEPTTGFDPPSRPQLWDVVWDLRDEGTTIVRTTQYLEEADRLADMISVVGRGQIIAEGTAEELKACVGGEVLELQASRHATASAGASPLAARLGVNPRDVTLDVDSGRAMLPIPSGSLSVFAAGRILDEAGIELDEITLRRSSLDDVFLTLTGHAVVTAGPEPIRAVVGSR